MAGTFEIVILVVMVVAVLAAIVSLLSGGDLYRSIGRGGLSLDEPDTPRKGPPAGSAQANAEAEAEIRQMVEAKSARRVARGESALDVDREVADLTRESTGGGHDEGLREEVRQLVEASNERRLRRGEEPLDVEAEVDRQLRELG